MKTYGEVVVKLYVLLTSALVAGHAPVALPTGKEPVGSGVYSTSNRNEYQKQTNHVSMEYSAACA
jgi:hypothetical protein